MHDDAGYQQDRIEFGRDKVKAPAIAMLIVAAIAIIIALLNFLNAEAADPMEEMTRQIEQDESLSAEEREEALRMVESFGGVVAVFVSPVVLLVGVLAPLVILFGAIAMLKLKSRGLAMAGAILAMLPWGCCCVLTLPVGLWALVVLNHDDVKLAFESAT